jgi:hypothetical protein
MLVEKVELEAVRAGLGRRDDVHGDERPTAGRDGRRKRRPQSIPDDDVAVVTTPVIGEPDFRTPVFAPVPCLAPEVLDANIERPLLADLHRVGRLEELETDAVGALGEDPAGPQAVDLLPRRVPDLGGAVARR